MLFLLIAWFFYFLFLLQLVLCCGSYMDMFIFNYLGWILLIDIFIFFFFLMGYLHFQCN